ncbi:MAG: fumarate hydratase [Coriobacteriia bacterium]|nr:fumarate hydratase [Coriobacteriia bacterium]
MTSITTADIARTVEAHLQTIASELRPDVLSALVAARQDETNPMAQRTLDTLIENAKIAAKAGVPLCQDTGTAWVLVELAADAQADLRGLQAAIDQAVQRNFTAHGLRASTVRDAYSNRSNPGTNLPAFVELVHRPDTDAGMSADNGKVICKDDRVATIHTMLKGAGTDNSGCVAMLNPSSGEAGIEQLLLDTLHKRASMTCPPLIIGIGIGGTFDSVAGLSKRALLRPINSSAAGQQTADLEQRLLQVVNATGIGSAALGGNTTALAVHVHTAPSHIASLPVAINLHCHSLRTRTTHLNQDGCILPSGLTV